MGETKRIIVNKLGRTIPISRRKTVIADRKKPRPNIKKYIIAMTGMIMKACQVGKLPSKTIMTVRKHRLTNNGTIDTKMDAMGSISVLKAIFFTTPLFETTAFAEFVKPSLIASHGP
jgi:hypothetical protein